VLVDRDGIVYVSDIGIFDAVTSPGPLALVHELRWSAPEKVLYQEEHTPACDVWSFGMTVIEVRLFFCDHQLCIILTLSRCTPVPVHSIILISRES
jgi:serine/threonine protein kinase